MTRTTTHAFDVPGATLTYDVHRPDSPNDQRPLFIFGSPMGASGFEQLVDHFTDRTVITYDPRGMERSSRDTSRGALGEGGLAQRGGEALARLLGVVPVIFPGDHGGFITNESSPGNDPAAFAAKLREVLREG